MPTALTILVDDVVEIITGQSLVVVELAGLRHAAQGCQ